MLGLLVLAVAVKLASVGGGLYEFLVVDPYWPQRLELIQPGHGGISRRRFWIPIHVVFELLLIATLVLGWSQETVRNALLVALASHAVMRIWSAVDFIPKAIRFETAGQSPANEAAARRWTQRSLLRLPIDLVTCGALLVALVTVVRSG